MDDLDMRDAMAVVVPAVGCTRGGDRVEALVDVSRLQWNCPLPWVR